MRRALMRIALMALVILPVCVPLAGEDASSGDGERTAGATAAVAVVTPEKEGSASEATPPRETPSPERQALDRIADRYVPMHRQLQELAAQAKGMELAEIQKRIETLKAQQEQEGLQARIEAARQTGDDRRVKQLQQVSDQSKKPRAQPVVAPEFRPVPDQNPNGGAR